MRHPAVRRLAFAAALLAACSSGSGGGEERGPGQEPPHLSPSLEPGTYQTYELAVTFTTQEPDAELFAAVGEDAVPVVEAGRGKQQSVAVRILKSTQVVVAVLWKGRTWGPYRYEYVLTPVHANSGCMIDPVTDTYVRPSENISIHIWYDFASALSSLEVQFGDRKFPLETADYVGDQRFSFPAGSVEGAMGLFCRVLQPGVEGVNSEVQTIVVDGTPPAASWVSQGLVTRENWSGGLLLQAGDGLSGVAKAEVCAAGFSVCAPARDAGGGTFVFATGLTTESSFVTPLAARITDRAGNTATLAALTVDTTAFARARAQFPAAVTAVVVPAVDLTSVAGGGVHAAVRIGGGAVDPAAANLAVGWNDFAFQPAPGDDWRSFGVYRAGVRVTLPASTAPWLLYAGTSTAVAVQFGLAATRPAAAVTQVVDVPALRVPHWLWVRDVDGDGRWGGADELFTLQGDTFTAPDFAVNALVSAGLAAAPRLAAAVTTAAWVSCTDCQPGGTLYFERRSTAGGVPVGHEELAVTLPGSFALAHRSGERCGLFWDEDGDGALAGDEPRAWIACDAASAELARESGTLRIDPVAGHVLGAHFGGVVTATTRILSATGTVLVSEPTGAARDRDGFGVVEAADLFGPNRATLLDAPTRVELWSAGRAYAAVFTAPAGTGDASYTIAVSDETGAPIAGVVDALVGFSHLRRVTADDGTLDFPISGSIVPEFFAERSGYLSQRAGPVGHAVALRLLDASVTGRVAGTLRSRSGAPLAGAALEWAAGPYLSRTLTGGDGRFSLPVSGGDGLVTVRAPGRLAADVAFALAATQAAYARDFTVDTLDDGEVSFGTHLGYLPFGIDAGGGTLAAYQDGSLYALPATTGPITVIDYHGVRRRVELPGLLPGDAGAAGVLFEPPFAPDLAKLAVRTECGDRVQEGFGAAIIDAPCWSWLASDDQQSYYLGRVSPATGFPAYAGFSSFVGSVFTGASPAPSQELLFQDVLFGRVIRGAVGAGGSFNVVLPNGVYQVHTLDGATLVDAGGLPVRITAASAALPYIVLFTP